MKNPLIKRLPRELKGEIGKYIVLFLFITMMIGIVSGFLVAAGSMSGAYDESFEKYNIESGNFELLQKADDDAIKKIEDGEEKIKVYENFYLDKETKWFCQYHLTHFIRTRIMQRERYDHSRAFFGLPEAAHRWRCRFFC